MSIIIAVWFLISVWQFERAWQRHEHSILSTYEPHWEYAVKWGLYRWMLSLTLLVPWFFGVLKRNNLVSQVDWWFSVYQYGNNINDYKRKERKVFDDKYAD